jgi:hypothetical protein
METFPAGNVLRPVQVLSFTRVFLALLLFGVSFGYVEAAAVVYLRGLYEPLHERLHPGVASGELFPLIRLDQLQAAGPQPTRWLAIELARELATLLLLAAAALAVAQNFRQWFAAFAVVFGVWDLFYYVFLKVLLDWPASLLTWDLLFLLPVPWASPVLAPVLVAGTMILAGALVLRRELAGRPLRIGLGDWGAVGAGAVILVAAFCWDCRNLLEGGVPNSFNWPLFVLGEGIGIGGVLHAWRWVRPAETALP